VENLPWLSCLAKRQRRAIEEKRRIVDETLAPGASVSVVARRHDVNANQVFAWRRLHRRKELGNGAALVPVGVINEQGVVSTVSDLTVNGGMKMYRRGPDAR